MKKSTVKREGLSPRLYAAYAVVFTLVMFSCICIGSVNIPFKDTLSIILNTVLRRPLPSGISESVIISVRLPRVACVALVGASLSLCGGTMQGLFRNPLAEGSTLGVSSGASLGAVIAIASGLQIPGFPGGGVMITAIIFAFVTLVLIMAIAHKLDYSLSTNTIILVGVIFSMFGTSMISLVTAFSGEKVKNITFWTMGSLAGSTYIDVITILTALLICGGVILSHCRELNAFAIGESNARYVGIDVKRVKQTILISVSALIGICVSIGGTIGFVGLVIPHMTRMITGPNHRKLLPSSVFAGSVFLMLADLVGRTIIKPLELPVGVVTSIIGSIAFIYIFYTGRKVG